MKEEIKIFIENNQSLKGTFFEECIRKLFEKMRYDVDTNVQFTGSEIDLILNNRDRDEVIFVECKAKESLSSSDIMLFAQKVNERDAKYGYFLSSSEFQKQVSGKIKDYGDNEKFKHLSFWGPKKIIEMFKYYELIKDVDVNISNISLAKKILLFLPSGIYWVFIVQDGSVPSSFCAYYQNTGKPVLDDSELKKHLKEIKNLKNISDSGKVKNREDKPKKCTEEVVEVIEGEQWYDPLPTGKKYFIGRKNLKEELLSFFNDVHGQKTEKRVFYLEGKSGWGKSSLIACMRGEVNNSVHNKNKYFLYAVDSRSASSDTFPLLAFKKLLQKAIEESFITMEHTLFENPEIKFTSSYDILESESVKNFLKKLKDEKKVLILVFDQFEDVFRKEELSDVFRKFLLDVHNAQENIIIGFSWRKEVSIYYDNPSYSAWQNLRGRAKCITVFDFTLTEIKGVIKQLNTSIEKNTKKDLPDDLKRKIEESSQGLPWLTKKLCIHIYNQVIVRNKTIGDILDSNLNCKELFDDDTEILSPDELKILKMIARRGFEGNPYDTSDIEGDLTSMIVTKLIEKRLIVKSGSRHNIYWDIFRDFLVTGNITTIGESYLLRYSPSKCESVFLVLQKRPLIELTIKQIRRNIDSAQAQRNNEKTLINILMDLRNIGLISKVGDKYKLRLDKISFKEHVQKKFKEYTPYIKLKDQKGEINQKVIKSILKDTFKISASDKTWDSYANILINWITYCEIDLNIDSARSRGRNSASSALPRLYPDKVFSQFKSHLTNGVKISSSQVNNDLKFLGLLLEDGSINIKNSDDLKKVFIEATLRKDKIKELYELCDKNNFKKIDDILKNTDYLSEFDNKNSRKNRVYNVLAWVKYIKSTQNGESPINKKSTYIFCTPKKLLSVYKEIITNPKYSPPSEYEKKALNDFRKMGFLKKSPTLEMSEHGKKVFKMDMREFRKEMCKSLLKIKIFKEAMDIFDKNKSRKDNVVSMKSLFKEDKSTINKSRLMVDWVEFIENRT